MWLWLRVVLTAWLVSAAQDEAELADPLLPIVAAEEVTTTPSPENSASRHCFSAKPESCPPPDAACLCSHVNLQSVVCCHVPNDGRLIQALQCAGGDIRGDILNLHIRNATLSNLENFGHIHLVSLSVTDGHIDNLTTILLPELSCLNLSSNGIPDMAPDILQQMRRLKTLDLSNNNLTRLPALETPNVTVDISGNELLECQRLIHFLSDYPKMQFLNQENTFCLSSSNFTWFKSTDRVPLSQIESLKNINESCPPGCLCEPHRLVMVPPNLPTFGLRVNCSLMGLQKLPDLPPNVVFLNVSNNNITSLDALIEDDRYKDIQEFYADSNQISSILALEGSKFIDNFQILSLRENNITSLPTYILSNMFDRNNNDRRVNLGWNRLMCNCSVAQVVKVWLLSNKKHVPDYDQVLCDNPGDKLNQKVIDLDQNKVCVYPRDWTDYIYYIIAGEVCLLFLLVGKVSYDYWVFKTAGYLPWPASKMPKLPCDWVFE